MFHIFYVAKLNQLLTTHRQPHYHKKPPLLYRNQFDISKHSDSQVLREYGNYKKKHNTYLQQIKNDAYLLFVYLNIHSCLSNLKTALIHFQNKPFRFVLFLRHYHIVQIKQPNLYHSISHIILILVPYKSVVLDRYHELQNVQLMLAHKVIHMLYRLFQLIHIYPYTS